MFSLYILFSSPFPLKFHGCEKKVDCLGGMNRAIMEISSAFYIKTARASEMDLMIRNTHFYSQPSPLSHL
jgi:hypothetical protein